MAWITENRRVAEFPRSDQPVFSEAMRAKLREVYFPRYPTKRACLLPALHMVQHEHGWIPPQALVEVAEFLEMSPAEVLDTASFYEEYWLKPKGKYLIQVCRSLACEICGSRRLTDHIRSKLNLEPGQTTADGRFTLVELECLGSCGTAPAVLVNDVLYEDLTPQKLDAVLAALPDDPHQHKDPSADWG